MSLPTIVVMAKSPRPGFVKTRLCPDVDPVEAARLAEAALRDTLEAVATTRARRVLALEGPPLSWMPADFSVIRQRGVGLDERIASALSDAGQPALVIGADTPQVTAGSLGSALEILLEDGVDAVLGHAADGGWWALGLRGADPEAALVGVPMSTPWTGREQARRLDRLGLRVRLLPVERDVDRIEDAFLVAAAAPGSHFAIEFARVLSMRKDLVRAAEPVL